MRSTHEFFDEFCNALTEVTRCCWRVPLGAAGLPLLCQQAAFYVDVPVPRAAHNEAVRIASLAS